MTTECIVHQLREVEERYKDEELFTFDISRSAMARDCREHIEKLEAALQDVRAILSEVGALKSLNNMAK